MEGQTLEEVEGDGGGGDGDVAVVAVGEGASDDGEGVVAGVGNPNTRSSSRGGAVVVVEPYSFSNWHDFEVGIIYVLLLKSHLSTDKITSCCATIISTGTCFSSYSIGLKYKYWVSISKSWCICSVE